jgi:hypothetical protein
MSNEDAKALMAALAANFPAEQIHFKPAAISGNRALAICYVDARAIMDRLDEVLGLDGWQDEYQVLEDGSVVCRLRCRLGGEWLVKSDVGSPSEQQDTGDQVKAAFSDALKRAAVKFGVGRYLYRLPSQWVDWDPKKKEFRVKPIIPGNGGTAPPRTITEAERLELSKLLARKGKTVGAALKAVGCHAPDLAGLTYFQFQDLLVRLHKLPDKPADGGPSPSLLPQDPNGPYSDGA